MTRPALAIFDLDRTLTQFDTYLAFLGYLCRYNPKRLLTGPVLLKAVVEYKRGHHNNSWLKEQFWAAIAGGLPADQVSQWGYQFADLVCRHGLRDGGLRAIAEHSGAGDHLVLVSASFDVYVNAIGEQLGFDAVLCTNSEISSDMVITGRLDGPNCYGDEKIRRLQQYVRSPERFSQCIAYSDHHSDLELLKWADQGVAVHPTKILLDAAKRFSMTVTTDW